LLTVIGSSSFLDLFLPQGRLFSTLASAVLLSDLTDFVKKEGPQIPIQKPTTFSHPVIASTCKERGNLAVKGEMASFPLQRHVLNRNLGTPFNR